MANAKSDINERNKLNLVVKEYETLRSETIKCSDRQLQLFYILMVILSAAYGSIIAYQIFDILYIIPILVSPFLLRYIWEQRNVETISTYIEKEIEEKRIPSIVGYRGVGESKSYEQYWIAWQHYYNQRIGIAAPQSPDKHLALLLIVLISFAPSMIYSILFVISTWTSMSIPSYISYIPRPYSLTINILALIIYILFTIYFTTRLGVTLLISKWIKKRNQRHKPVTSPNTGFAKSKTAKQK